MDHFAPVPITSSSNAPRTAAEPTWQEQGLQNMDEEQYPVILDHEQGTSEQGTRVMTHESPRHPDNVCGHWFEPVAPTMAGFDENNLPLCTRCRLEQRFLDKEKAEEHTEQLKRQIRELKRDLWLHRQYEATLQQEQGELFERVNDLNQQQWNRERENRALPEHLRNLLNVYDEDVAAREREDKQPAPRNEFFASGHDDAGQPAAGEQGEGEQGEGEQGEGEQPFHTDEELALMLVSQYRAEHIGESSTTPLDQLFASTLDFADDENQIEYGSSGKAENTSEDTANDFLDTQNSWEDQHTSEAAQNTFQEAESDAWGRENTAQGEDSGWGAENTIIGAEDSGWGVENNVTETEDSGWGVENTVPVAEDSSREAQNTTSGSQQPDAPCIVLLSDDEYAEALASQYRYDQRAANLASVAAFNVRNKHRFQGSLWPQKQD
ncbi:hypothetical protein DOTSEDRAFT_20777 [Dothistroma septosporum NZE10]|uniref:Uncharacterized protein n=1 Tax=Dothistroma septosporum (strain NZE10 / CBS 128990) TaxID=675120 RepID=N1PVI8_DOTSN|nr:hypothetical protein DOTSEDRAFT_20777 [Dothistroma septosporum NZE10]